MAESKSRSLYWKYGNDRLYGRNRFKRRVANSGALSDWIKQYQTPKPNTPQKSDKQMQADFRDRVEKLTQLLAEDILDKDETLVVKKELEELKDILNG